MKNTGFVPALRWALAPHLFLPVVLAAGFLAVIAGCGENPLGRRAIYGKIMLDNAPVAHGNIAFEPLQPGGVGSGGVIKDGKYSIPAAEGLPTGKYRVAIYASDPSAAVLPPGGMPGDDVPVPKELVPPDWNVNSNHSIEVKESEPGEFNFNVTTK